MHGYMLVESKYLKPGKHDGIEPAETEMGLLDFIREVSAQEPSIPRMFSVKLTGLEDLLFSSDAPKTAAREIFDALKKAASLLEQKLVFVQVVFSGKIVGGDKIRVEYRAKQLPINLIFGAPSPDTDESGNKCYKTSFNLS